MPQLVQSVRAAEIASILISDKFLQKQEPHELFSSGRWYVKCITPLLQKPDSIIHGACSTGWSTVTRLETALCCVVAVLLSEERLACALRAEVLKPEAEGRLWPSQHCRHHKWPTCSAQAKPITGAMLSLQQHDT